MCSAAGHKAVACGDFVAGAVCTAADCAAGQGRAGSETFLAKHQKFYDAGEKTPTYTITANNEIKISDFEEQNLTQIQKRNRVNQAIKEKIKSVSMN